MHCFYRLRVFFHCLYHVGRIFSQDVCCRVFFVQTWLLQGRSHSVTAANYNVQQIEDMLRVASCFNHLNMFFARE